MNNYLRNEGVQDFWCKLVYARILFSETYELIHIACRLLQILYLLFLLRQLGIYALLLIRIAAGQHTELLVVYSAEDIVLIQSLEQCIKLRRPFRQSFIFTLLGVKLPSVFRGAFFVDKFRKLPFSCSCRVGNTAQLLEQYLIQYHLTDSVRRAFIFCIIAVMRAVEGIAFRIVRTLVIKIQFRAAVGTEQQTGILTCFTCACRSALTLTQLLHGFLILHINYRFVRMFKTDMLGRITLHLTLVFV